MATEQTNDPGSGDPPQLESLPGSTTRACPASVFPGYFWPVLETEEQAAGSDPAPLFLPPEKSPLTRSPPPTSSVLGWVGLVVRVFQLLRDYSVLFLDNKEII